MICALSFALLVQSPVLPAPVRAVGPTLRFGDYDGDGLEDVYAVRPVAGDRLFKNLGDGTFVDVTDASGLGEITGSRQALWQDFDGDGRLDLYVSAAGGASRLLRNDGAGLFLDVTEAAGVAHADGAELYAAWVDFDLDWRPDLHLVTERGDRLLRNAGDGLFERTALPALSELDGGVIAIDAPASGAGSQPASAGPGGYTIGASPGQPAMTVCLPRMADQAGGCLEASSAPELGKLYPLSQQLMVSPNGNVGVGVLTPSRKLQVQGEMWASDVVTGKTLASTASTGTPPLAVTSTTTVPNLSADRLDGLDSGAFTQLGQTIEGTEIADFSVTFSDIAIGAVTSSKVLDESLTAADIAAGAVGTSEIANGSVTGADVGFATLTGFNVQDFSLVASDLASNAVTDIKVSAGAAIQGSKIVPDFGSQDVVTTGRIGAGTSTPTADLHVLGSTSRGLALIAPDQATGSGDADLFLAEDDDGSFGFRVRYDGVGNDLQFRGKNAGGDTIHMSIDRDSGFAWLGAASASTGSRLLVEESGSNKSAILGKSDTGVGVDGETASINDFGVFSIGNFGATGAKLFVQPHPQDASKQLHFVSLEGNESGTYFRGSSQLIGGEAVIDVPEDFRLASDSSGLTAQVTAVGLPAALYVVSKDLDRIVVRGNVDVDFDYFVNGVRRGYRDFETVAPNRAFVPTERGVPFGTQYPDAYRQILVENGILNADFTPNEATAAAMGWELRDPGTAAVEPQD